MLSIIPLVWFSGLFVFLYSSKKACLSMYATLMYVITSLCAFIMYKTDLVEYDKLNVSFISTVIYCLLISLSILPLYSFDKKNHKTIQVRNPQFVKWLIYFYLFCFLFLIIFYWRDIVFRIVLGDWDDIRVSAAMGDAYSIRQATGVLRPVTILVNVMSSISFVMLPIFFINIIYLKTPWRYNMMAIIGSLSSFVVAILAADRSRIFIWLIILGLCIFYFWDSLSKSSKRKVFIMMGTIVLLALSYIVIVTMSRYGDSNEGAFSSIITYAGQPYHNFCFFFDNFNNKEGINTRILFPFTHTMIIGDYLGGVDLQQTMTSRTGIYCGVFYTFLGTFILDSNQIGPFLFIALYLLVWKLFQKRRKSLSLMHFFIIFFLSIIPTYGCISYMYSHWYLTVAVALILVTCKLSGNNKTFKHEDNNRRRFVPKGKDGFEMRQRRV